MQLRSTAFLDGQTIPRRYTQFAENISPPLEIVDVPVGTVSLALTMDDPDVPPQAGVPVWDHWVAFNIAPDVRHIPEGAGTVGVSGRGTRGSLLYSGPRPPDREHRYFFTVYALNAVLPLAEGATKDDVLQAMQGHVVAKATLMGRCAP